MMTQDIRLSISEAGRIFGVSEQTVRRGVKAQEVKYIVVRGRYRLSFQSLLKWSQASTSVRNKLAKHGVGQFVTAWKINNTLYSPHPQTAKRLVSSQDLSET